MSASIQTDMEQKIGMLRMRLCRLDVDIHDGIVSQRTSLRHSQRALVNDTARYL